jgi:hypothetical protein
MLWKENVGHNTDSLEVYNGVLWSCHRCILLWCHVPEGENQGQELESLPPHKVLSVHLQHDSLYHNKYHLKGNYNKRVSSYNITLLITDGRWLRSNEKKYQH